ncbi:hypothetical protein Dcar01_02864 [Deinococcus carri]|uniref:Acyl-CoA thioester hydrolase n=1 Tax=Deinococcus carri TaxID=1211323 RepID=A0ABP9W9T6_9DEIO
MPLNVTPDALLSAPFNLQASELPPLTEVTVTAETTDIHGEVWRSWASFRTSDDGQLDLAHSPALDGSYQGTDPSGLIWSLRPRPALFPAFFEMPPGGYDLTLSLLIGEQEQDRATTRRLSRWPDLQVQDVRENGLYGQLFMPAPGRELRGACLCLGGSEGGLYDTVAALLASEGFVVLNLAYFGVPDSGLPADLINLPLEYFHDAIRWLRARPEVVGRRIGVTGASKGAEAALLTGSMFPEEVGAVAAIASGGLVFEGIDRTGQFPAGQRMSSWSLGGDPLPYIPYRADWQAFFAGPGPYNMTPIHREAVARASREEIGAATIPVERIAGPVLLVSGGEDQVWPATELSEVAQFQREQAGLPVQHLADPAAGHSLSLPGLPTYVSVPWTAMGGEEQANAHLQALAWQARVETLSAVWK